MLQLPGEEIDLPIVSGTEDEHWLDISALRDQTGYITVDPGYSNTGACESAITFIDGETGVLRYRGYPIEELAEQSTLRGDGLALDLWRASHARRSSASFASLLTEQELLARGDEEPLRGLPPPRASHGDALGDDQRLRLLPS